MADRKVNRRLAAILAADVAGYTRLMEDDTDGTVAAWQDAREAVIKPGVAEYSGTIVKLTGDGFLVEFPTVQDAVNCAIAMQEGLGASRLDFRMGINMGDIVDDGEDIHGEGVNVAARLEGLALPGGIVISGDVYNQVRNRIEAAYTDMGPQDVKNVSAPVPAYSIRIGAPAVQIPGEAIADRPSIAVLPFDNLSGDPEQEYFSDGITEDIISGLSRIRTFFVIARNSTFQYKGTSPDIRRLANELGVRYVLQGSVRKAGNRVRISAQLIDGVTGNHLWAEKYDRELEDIFAVQDEITQTVVGALQPELDRAEQQISRKKKPEYLNAWESFQKGMWHCDQRDNTGVAEARILFRRATEVDPEFDDGYAGIAWTHLLGVLNGEESLDGEEAKQSARRALSIDTNSPLAHFSLGAISLIQRNSTVAIEHLNKAIELNPSYAQAHHMLSRAYSHIGEPKDALFHGHEAIRLSPNDPTMGSYCAAISLAHLYLREHEDAAIWAQKGLDSAGTGSMTYPFLISALGHLGRLTEAEAIITAFRSNHPRANYAFFRDDFPTTDEACREHLIDGLRLAGLFANE